MAYAYFNADGALLSVSSGQMEFPDSIAVEVPDGQDANAIYYDLKSGKVTEKSEFSIEVSYNKAANVPQGTRILYERDELISDGSDIEFEADVMADLLIYLDHPHYKAMHITIPTGPDTE